MLDVDFYGWAVGALSLGLALSGVFILMLDRKIEASLRVCASEKIEIARSERAAAYKDAMAAHRANQSRVPGL